MLWWTNAGALNLTDLGFSPSNVVLKKVLNLLELPLYVATVTRRQQDLPHWAAMRVTT